MSPLLYSLRRPFPLLTDQIDQLTSHVSRRPLRARPDAGHLLSFSLASALIAGGLTLVLTDLPCRLGTMKPFSAAVLLLAVLVVVLPHLAQSFVPRAAMSRSVAGRKAAGRLAAASDSEPSRKEKSREQVGRQR